MRMLAGIALLALSGCAAKHVGLNYDIPIQSASRIELRDCDRASPPNCKRIQVSYCRGCEVLEAKPVGQFVIRGDEIITKIGPRKYRVDQLPGPSTILGLPDGIDIGAK